MNENDVKFLIIRLSSIGDIVLTTPVIRCLKKQVPNSIVHFITKPQYVEILKFNPYIDKIHVYENFQKTIQEIKAEGFDYIIDLHKNLRAKRLINKLKILDFSFPKLNFEKFLIVNFKINKLPDIHIVDRYFEAVKLFDVKNDNKGLDFFLDVNIKQELLSKSIIIPEKYIAFAIGAQHNTKKLPTAKIIEICNKINCKIILLGGKEDSANSLLIKESCNNTMDLCGKISLQASAYIVKESFAVITHDTGLMHIAAAFKKNILSVWGTTIPEFGMSPYLAGESSKIFEINDLKCRPCSKLGKKKCPKKHFKCMNDQNSDAIANYINQLLKNLE